MGSRKTSRSIKRLHHRGLNDLEISGRLGISTEEVVRERRRLGLRSSAELERRRRILWGLGGVGLLALAGGWYLASGRREDRRAGATEPADEIDPAVALRRETEIAAFENALHAPEKRPAFVQSLLASPPPYATLEYADESVLRGLWQRHSYVAPPNALATSIATEQNHMGEGSSTRICVLPTAFMPELLQRPDMWADSDLILRVVIRNHELLHADHFYRGIEGYEIDEFRGTFNAVNRFVFTSVSELLGHQAEYRGLREVRSLGTSTFLGFYTDNIHMLMTPHYQALQVADLTAGLDPEFVQRIRDELHPDRLLGAVA